MQGRKQYQEKLFISFRLSDRVPENNFYRRLNNSLDLNFLYKSTSKYYGKEGTPGLDPVVFFKLILTGYFHNLQSDRSIIENARLRMDILFFIGYNIDEELPWHSTISRTRQLLGEEVFQELFQKVLIQCIDKGMIAGKRQAIDSVLIKANAAMDSLQTLKILEDGANYVTNLSCEEDEDDEPKPVQRQGKNNSRHQSTTDPDARIATKPGKPRQMNYLGQVSVDTGHHVITNMEVHFADKRDSQCFEQALLHTIENLGQGSIKIEEAIADTNYSSIEALKAAEKQHVTAYIPNVGQYKKERVGFKYFAEGDYYQCEQGTILPFKKLRISRGRNLMKDYIALTKDCKECALKTSCIGKKNYKTLSHSSEKELYDQMNERMKTSYARKLRKLRQSTVEPVIGTLVNFMAMKKIRTKGIVQANKYAIGAAIAYNLKKMLKWPPQKPKTVAIAMSFPIKIKLPEPLSILFQKINLYKLNYQPVWTL